LRLSICTVCSPMIVVRSSGDSPGASPCERAFGAGSRFSAPHVAVCIWHAFFQRCSIEHEMPTRRHTASCVVSRCTLSGTAFMVNSGGDVFHDVSLCVDVPSLFLCFFYQVLHRRKRDQETRQSCIRAAHSGEKPAGSRGSHHNQNVSSHHETDPSNPFQNGQRFHILQDHIPERGMLPGNHADHWQ
jgi:hypothetical protein